MKPAQMDTDLAGITEPQRMRSRIGYWETRRRLSNLNPSEQAECERIAIRHASRIVRRARAG